MISQRPSTSLGTSEISDALTAATARLAAVSDTPRLDAEVLMAHALGVEREAMLIGALDVPAPPAFAALVDRRMGHEPIAYITGRKGFWSIDIAVAPGALIPRPDSETLIDAAVAHFGTAGPRRILDLGTGPGSLLLAALAEWPSATGLGVDRYANALAQAKANADRLGLADRAQFRIGDWGEGIDEAFDLILCNPPYVETDAALPADVAEWEPAGALFAGPDGLDDYRRLAPQLPRLIVPGGIACVEIGITQVDAAGALFRAIGLSVSVRDDLTARPRCLVLSH